MYRLHPYLRRFIAGLCALALSASQAAAGSFVNAYMFGGVSTPSLTFVGCTDNTTNGTTFTFSSASLGTDGTRTTLLGIMVEDDAGTFSVSGVTVGGNAASEQADSAGTESIVGAIYSINSTGMGTSANIVVTPSEAATGATVCVWAAYNLNSITATDFATEQGVVDINLVNDVQAFGVVVVVAGRITPTGSTWTGCTERQDSAAFGAEFGSTAADYTEDGTATTGLDCAVNLSAGSNKAGAGAAFR